MRIVLVTGGARSGKSRYAEKGAGELAGDDVTYIATATAGDPEMAERIARHKADRPEAWTLVEAPYDPGGAVADAATLAVILDCLTLAASNAALAALGNDRPGEADSGAEPGPTAEADVQRAVDAVVDAIIAAAGSRDGTLFVVTNEIGMGVVPPSRLGRWFRDAMGRANRRVAEAADEVVLLVAGIPVAIRSGEGR